MKPGPSLRLGRAFSLCVSVLLLIVTALCSVSAQTSGRKPGAGGTPAPGQRPSAPLSSHQLHDLPLQRISRKDAASWMNQVSAAAAAESQPRRAGVAAPQNPTPPSTTPQYYDLTTNPRPPLIGPSTKSQEIHPAWSWDQQSIYFASNNVDSNLNQYGLTAPPANALFHIYKMSSNGSFIERITGSIPAEANGQQLYPALNHAQTKLAYVHRDDPSRPYQLYLLDFFTGQRTQVTGRAGSAALNQNLIDVQHPSWSPGDGFIAFAARDQRIPGDRHNVYVVNVSNNNAFVVDKVTNASPASGVEAIDPVFHPDSPQNGIGRITFAANTGNPANGAAINVSNGDLNYVANPLQDLDGDRRVNDIDHNLFIVSQAGPSLANPIVQLTTATSDDIEPAYQQSDYPVGTFPTAGAFNNWLAFASKGRRPDPNTPVGRTYDIYFNDGGPEASSTPIRLFTPDTNAGAIPLNQSDERYPTWSSALPPQSPIDRIAFQSNRQMNLNDPTKPTVSATDWDIWAAEVTDITPPTLFSLGDESLSYIRAGVTPGETLHIANAPLPNPGRRIGAPRDTFYFYTKVQDLQYGIESVWIQIKDPDGPSTDARGVDHKLYGIGRFPGPLSRGNNAFPVRFTGSPPVPTHWLHMPFETDYDGVSTGNYSYFRGPVRYDWATTTNAQYPSFAPGVDDSIEWSGNQISPFWAPGPGSPWTPTPVSNRPPLINPNGDPNDASNHRWLRLQDDGRFPDQVASDGVYSAQWRTPTEPSDFYVDVIAYDKAFNPRNPSERQNWIIYDNIWGFSTQAFISRNPVLYVDDNGAGQKWPRGLKGAFRPFPVFRYGTESDIIDRGDAFYPREVSLGVLSDIAGAGSFAPGITNQMYPFLAGSSTPYDFISWAREATRAYKYDIWRILAKGPITQSVLNDYVPTTDRQPLDITGTNLIDRPVPRRAVLWNAPYTGDIFLGSGSILDEATQTLLTNYRNRAGRLVIAGGDIVWALTVNGAIPNQPFVADVLGANFEADETYGNHQPFIGDANGIAGDITLDRASRGFLPLGSPPWWGPLYDPDVLGTQTHWTGFWPNPPHPPASGNEVPFTASTDGTPFRTQDRITPRAGWEPVYDGRMIVRQDAQTQSKSVFMSFSLASMGRRLGAESDDEEMHPLLSLNYRAKVSHAMFCWMFSADLTGRIRNLDGGRPVVGAWVQAYQGGQLVGSAFSDTDGTYIIRGLPVGGWTLQVDNPGFLSFNKATGDGAHGLGQPLEDVFLTPAAPGSITGIITDTFNQPIAGATVTATLNASPLYTGQRIFSAVSGLDGRYIIPNAPVGTYVVEVTPPFPTGFANPNPASYPAVQVTPATQTTGIDFTLEGQPGGLKVTVLEAGSNKAIPQADVSLQDAAGNVIATQVTNAAGQTNFTNVPAGPVTVSAFKFGFQEGSAPADVPQDTEVTLRLIAAQKRDLYGLAVRAADGQPLASDDLRDPVRLQLLRPSGVPTPLQATVFAPPQANPTQHNYKFTGAQEGQFIVSLPDGHPRYLPAQVTVDITSTLPNKAPNLQLQGRPGILSGTVREQGAGGAAGAAIPDATVEIRSKGSGNVVATLKTGTDGKWATTANIPSDSYTVTVSKFGFSTGTKDVFVAGNTDTGNILLQRGPRGQLYGLVRRSIDQAERDGVVLEFWANTGAGFEKITEVTSFTPLRRGPDGGFMNYVAGDTATSAAFLPAGDYQIRVNDPRFRNVSRSVTVTGGARQRVDLDLVPLSGVLRGKVLENQGSGSPGKPISGATVRITRNGSGSPVATLTTNAQGEYQTANALSAAQYTVSASAFGYVDNQVSVFVEGPTTAPDILLTKTPPSTISGAVTNSLDKKLVGGVTVELLPTNGAGPAIRTTTSTNNGSGNPIANYKLTQVAPGTYLVRASRAGLKTAQRQITVQPGQNPTGIDLQLEPEFTFGKGLLMVSIPYNMRGQDAAAVLGQPSSTFKSAYWITSQERYAIYPERPAAEFALGKALFVRFHERTAFTGSGTPAPNSDLVVALQSGWNMIGSGRRIPIDWLRVKVDVGDGRPARSMQQAYKDGIIQNGVFKYVEGYSQTNTLEPFLGVFVRAFRDCRLIIPVDNSITAAPQDLQELRERVAAYRAGSGAQAGAAAELPLRPARPAQEPARRERNISRLPIHDRRFSLAAWLMNPAIVRPWTSRAG